MGLLTRTPQVDLRPSPAATRHAAWFEICPEDLSLWNGVLLRSDTSLYQYPFWNEPYRPLCVIPHYLAWGTQDRPLAYVCILTVGFGPSKIGLVFRGPVCLQAGAELPSQALHELVNWAHSTGYIFIRFTHSDPQVLRQMAALSDARRVDAFPYFLDYPVLSPDFVVEQCPSEEETLASFDREVRRKIRRANEIGYEFRSTNSPQELAKLWPLHQDCSRRKHFRLERPLSVYMLALQLAQPHDCARVYSVYLSGRPVGSTLTFRDRTTAHCVLAAFDAAHRQAAVFLHWRSMRDMYCLGAPRYNLGPGPGSLARFKKQFAPHTTSYPGPLTVVLREDSFKVWCNVVLPVARALRPMLRGIVSHLRR